MLFKVPSTLLGNFYTFLIINSGFSLYSNITHRPSYPTCIAKKYWYSDASCVNGGVQIQYSLCKIYKSHKLFLYRKLPPLKHSVHVFKCFVTEWLLMAGSEIVKSLTTFSLRLVFCCFLLTYFAGSANTSY